MPFPPPAERCDLKDTLFSSAPLSTPYAHVTGFHKQRQKATLEIAPSPKIPPRPTCNNTDQERRPRKSFTCSTYLFHVLTAVKSQTFKRRDGDDKKSNKSMEWGSVSSGWWSYENLKRDQMGGGGSENAPISKEFLFHFLQP